MMERVEVEVKRGFVDLIFSIYQNMPREACDALETMGVLRKGVDRFSIERIARNMLGSFQSTLASADNKWETLDADLCTPIRTRKDTANCTQLSSAGAVAARVLTRCSEHTARTILHINAQPRAPFIAT